MSAVLVLMLALSGYAAAQDQAASSASEYLLGPGDVIDVSVFGEEDLSFQDVRLSDAGTLQFPFIGTVVASDRTARELEETIRQGLLDDYLVDPRVSVRVKEYRSFFINGEVKNPGGYPYQPGLTVRKAVVLAGGFTEWASKSEVSLIRDSDPEGKPVKVRIDSQLSPGDIVTVNQGLF